MYLTRIAVNPFLAEARKVLDDTHALHRAVMGMFDSYRKDDSGVTTNRAKGTGVPLWRLDAGRDSISLFVVSGDKPHTADLARRIGWDDGTDGAVMVADYDGFLDGIREGDTYAFKTTLNMVTRGRDGKSRAAVPPNDKMVWLSRTAQRNGFKVNGIPDVFAIVDTFEKPDGKRVTLDKSTVTGVLTVTDADRMRRALSAGIGRGRAYGCGLITLAAAE